MTSFRHKLLESPARYQCIACGERLSEFHLCWSCYQPIHPRCTCHPLDERLNNSMSLSSITRKNVPQQHRMEH